MSAAATVTTVTPLDLEVAKAAGELGAKYVVRHRRLPQFVQEVFGAVVSKVLKK